MRQKTIGTLLVVVMVALITGCALLEVSPHAHDDYVRNRTVLLHLPTGGSCTGTMTQSPYNGKYYIVTAGHCFHPAPPTQYIGGDSTYGELENGQIAYLELLKVDYTNDIAVLDNPWSRGLTIGNLASPHESVKVIAWGAGVPPYVSCGEIIRSVFVFDNDGHAVQRLLSSARIIPGCSGGPMVNDNNELVGIMLITYEESAFSNGTPTFVITDFMKDLP